MPRSRISQRSRPTFQISAARIRMPPTEKRSFRIRPESIFMVIVLDGKRDAGAGPDETGLAQRTGAALSKPDYSLSSAPSAATIFRTMSRPLSIMSCSQE